jgi:hypothetical protein
MKKFNTGQLAALGTVALSAFAYVPARAANESRVLDLDTHAAFFPARPAKKHRLTHRSSLQRPQRPRLWVHRVSSTLQVFETP